MICHGMWILLILTLILHQLIVFMSVILFFTIVIQHTNGLMWFENCFGGNRHLFVLIKQDGERCAPLAETGYDIATVHTSPQHLL